MSKNKITVYLAGDSTVAFNGPDTFPQAGWGQMIGKFFSEDVVFENHAVNGRSSKSFIDEKRLEAIDDKIREGDYLFIQFGHNDSKPDPTRRTEPDTTYRECLGRYIRTARDHKAVPVLVTSMHRRHFDNAGKIIDTHEPYHKAMRVLAIKENIVLLDLGGASRALFEKLGACGSEKLFMHLAPDEYPNYPAGQSDDTHLTVTGALEIAGLLAGEIKRTIPLLGEYCHA